MACRLTSGIQGVYLSTTYRMYAMQARNLHQNLRKHDSQNKYGMCSTCMHGKFLPDYSIITFSFIGTRLHLSLDFCTVKLSCQWWGL